MWWRSRSKESESSATRSPPPAPIIDPGAASHRSPRHPFHQGRRRGFGRSRKARRLRNRRGRRPVLPAIISFTTEAAVRRARRAEAMGAEALLLAPIVPELYAGRSERDVVRFHEDVSGATALPILLFNYPSLTGVDLTPDLVERLASIPNVRGIKESTGDSRRISTLLRRLASRIQRLCRPPTAALESLALGCTSWITGILN